MPGAGAGVVAGGVAANGAIRAMLQSLCGTEGFTLCFPPASLCSDNGAMVASLGSLMLQRGIPASAMGYGADPGAPVSVPLVSAAVDA